MPILALNALHGHSVPFQVFDHADADHICPAVEHECGMVGSNPRALSYLTVIGLAMSSCRCPPAKRPALQLSRGLSQAEVGGIYYRP